MSYYVGLAIYVQFFRLHKFENKFIAAASIE